MAKLPKKDSNNLPVFLLAGVFLILALIVRLVSHFYEETHEPNKKKLEFDFLAKQLPQKTEQTGDKALTIRRPDKALDLSRDKLNKERSGNVFEDIHMNYATYAPNTARTAPLKKAEIPYYSFNPVQGNEQSKVKVHLFFDSACASCRTSINQFLKRITPLKKDILLVYKFMPINKKESEGGIFDQIAWRSGKFDTYVEELLKRNTAMKTEDYMSLLERIGIPLKRQQKIMQESMHDIVAVNQNDIVLAEELNIYQLGHNPTYFVNGYRLGQARLPENDVNLYIQRLRDNEPILSE